MAELAPTLMIGLPLLGALIMLLVGRVPRVALLCGAGVVALLWLVVWTAAPQTVDLPITLQLLAGRALELTQPVRLLFLFGYTVLGVAIVLTWWRPQGTAFAPAGMAMMAPAAAALMIRPASTAPVYLAVAALCLVPALVAGRSRAAAAATWRFFLVLILAVPLLLLADWLLLSGGAADPAARLTLTLAALLLFGGFPFYIWVSRLARASAPMPLLLAAGLLQLFVFAVYIQLLDQFPLVRDSIAFEQALRWSAALVGLIAAFQVSRSPSRRELFAYLLVMDFGLFGLTLLLPTGQATAMGAHALAARALALLLLAVGLNMPPGDPSATGRPARVARLLSLGLIGYGAATLVGLPLTPGYTARWAQLEAASTGGASWIVSFALIASLGAATFAILRLHLRAPQDDTGRDGDGGWGLLVAAVALLLFTLLLGLFPQVLLEYIGRASGVF